MIGVTDKALTQHMMIVGTPGFGKTTFAINLLLQFYDRGIPFLAIEPTKTEYRSLIDRIDRIIRIDRIQGALNIPSKHLLFFRIRG